MTGVLGRAGWEFGRLEVRQWEGTLVRLLGPESGLNSMKFGWKKGVKGETRERSLRRRGSFDAQSTAGRGVLTGRTLFCKGSYFRRLLVFGNPCKAHSENYPRLSKSQNTEITIIKIKTISNCKVSIRKSNKALILPFFKTSDSFQRNVLISSARVCWGRRPEAQAPDLPRVWD